MVLVYEKGLGRGEGGKHMWLKGERNRLGWKLVGEIAVFVLGETSG